MRAMLITEKTEHARSRALGYEMQSEQAGGCAFQNSRGLG